MSDIDLLLACGWGIATGTILGPRIAKGKSIDFINSIEFIYRLHGRDGAGASVTGRRAAVRRAGGQRMDVGTMLRVACGLIVLTALGGVVMAAIRFSGKRNPPVWLAMLHGLLAGSGVTVLAYAVFAGDVPAAAGWALGLFLVAALGGITLFLAYEWKRVLLPAWLVGVHALAAVLGFLLLLVAAFA
jgi:hypothetical protein